jgi:hypothetical protein
MFEICPLSFSASSSYCFLRFKQRSAAFLFPGRVLIF